MVPRIVFAAAAALLLLLAVASGASASLSLTHVSTEARELDGNRDGVVGNGDLISVIPSIRSATPMTGVTGSLSTTSAQVQVQQGFSAYPDAAAGETIRGATPFRALIPSNLLCGTLLAFTVSVDAAEDDGVVSFTVPSGAVGPERTHSSGGAVALPDEGVSEIQVEVPAAASGLVKGIRVAIPDLQHPDVGDLVLTLVAPDGTAVKLMDRRGAGGTGLTETVFAAGGGSLDGAEAPFTGVYAPEQDLGRLEGRTLNGTWTLRVQDTVADGQAGTLDGWRLQSRRAFCSGIPRARLAVEPRQLEPGGTVSFDASESFDEGGAIRQYEFDLDGDGEYEIGPTTDPTHSVAYPTRRTVQARLRVTDNEDLTDVRTEAIAVTKAPTAALERTSTGSPLTLTDVTFDAGASSDPDGSVVRYEWDLDGQAGFELDTGAAAQATTRFLTPGAKTVNVRVTDDNGAIDEQSVALTVENRAPTAALTAPAVVVAGRDMIFSAAGSVDADGTLQRFEWDLDGDGEYDDRTSATPTATKRFTVGGPATIGVRVVDDQGLTASAGVTVQVRMAPVVALSATPNPLSLRRTAQLDATGTTDADSPAASLAYAWDLDGDGDFDDATAAGPHDVSFTTAGVRWLGVRVTDPDGAVTERLVAVDVGNLKPLPLLTTPSAEVDTGAQVALSAAGTSDPDGAIVAYEWDLDGDGSFELSTGSVERTTASFPNPGYVRPAVRVTDDDGGTAVKRIDILVRRPPETPQKLGGNALPGEVVRDDAPAPTSAATAAAPPLSPAGPAVAAVRPPIIATFAGRPIQSLRSVLRNGIALTCRAAVAGRCVVEAELALEEARRLRLPGTKRASGSVRIGRTSAVLLAGHAARMTVRLSPAVRRRLASARTARIVLRGFTRDWTGKRVELTRVVLLRR